MKQRTQAESVKILGFTLIELSIVLVIIGLIVGGVLVGQDLIKAAEVRATVGQYEKYNTAINTFRTKYNGIPGDVTSPSTFGLFSTGMDGSASGLGDGNGLIQASGGTANRGVGETMAFWRHLSDAALIDGNYGSDLASGGVVNTLARPDLYLPAAKLGRGTYWVVGSYSGLNYYLLAGTSNVIANGTYTFGKGLTPIEAYNIDVKLDDGMPNLGIVQARGTATDSTLIGALAAGGTNAGVFHATGAEAKGDCLVGASAATDTANTYSRVAVSGNAPGCNLLMRFN